VGFLNGRERRRRQVEGGGVAAEAIEKAEVAWMERSVESAFDRARALLARQEPAQAKQALLGLVRDLSAVGAFKSSLKSSDGRVRKLARRAVVACLEAAGQEAKRFLESKQYEDAARTARRLQGDLAGPAQAVGLGPQLRDFSAAHTYLATLARQARDQGSTGK
jgi:hypothetical protein